MLIAALAAAAPARAQQLDPPRSIDPPPFPTPSQPPPAGEREHGVSFGARAGYAMPLGQAADGKGTDATSLHRALRGLVVLSLSAGYRPIPQVYFGAFFSYGYGLTSTAADSACPTGASCSGYQVRAGAEINVHILPGFAVDPWVGVGLGWEWLHFAADAPGTGQSFDGPELANLQVGADIKVVRGLHLGPFFMIGFGRYSSVTTGDAAGREILNKSVHEWLQLGLRAQYDL